MSVTKEITSSEDIIDSRDVIARIEYLEGYDEVLDDDERQELEELRELASEGEGASSEWTHGETLIRESYFVEYAEQLADDIGAIDSNAGWPTCHIDWDAAAASLKMDYTSVDFGGVEYWIRS